MVNKNNSKIKTFPKRLAGLFRVVENGEGFLERQVGEFLSIRFKGKKNDSIGAYFEGVEKINSNKQKVFLQYDADNEDSTENFKSQVIEYILPLDGKLSRTDFIEGRGNSYPISN